MEEYQITIIGDNCLDGVVALSDAEIATFRKVISALRPDGPYAPNIYIVNLSEEERELEARKERERQEEAAREASYIEECSHLGKYSIGSQFADLFRSAGWAV